jgi:hypothetical protein
MPLHLDDGLSHLRVRCLKQANPREDPEKLPVVGIIATELLPPRIQIHSSLNCDRSGETSYKPTSGQCP